jgi:hypothetical protein
VTTRVRRWRLALWVLALAVALSAVPVPLLAQEKSPPAAAPGIKASIQKAIATSLPAPARVRARAQDTATAPGQGSFFKTPAGVAVIAILAAGTGYAIYASRHDRIHSVVRQGQ